VSVNYSFIEFMDISRCNDVLIITVKIWTMNAALRRSHQNIHHTSKNIKFMTSITKIILIVQLNNNIRTSQSVMYTRLYTFTQRTQVTNMSKNS